MGNPVSFRQTSQGVSFNPMMSQRILSARSREKRPKLNNKLKPVSSWKKESVDKVI